MRKRFDVQALNQLVKNIEEKKQMAKEAENVLRERLAAARSAVPDRSLWTHRESKSLYEVLSVCLLEQYPETVMVTYRGCASGIVWVRQFSLFTDGRFCKAE